MQASAYVVNLFHSLVCELIVRYSILASIAVAAIHTSYQQLWYTVLFCITSSALTLSPFAWSLNGCVHRQPHVDRCWIPDTSVEDQALRFVVFYLPLWLAWVVNVLLYVIVHLRIKRILKQVRPLVAPLTFTALVSVAVRLQLTEFLVPK